MRSLIPRTISERHLFGLHGKCTITYSSGKSVKGTFDEGQPVKLNGVYYYKSMVYDCFISKNKQVRAIFRKVSAISFSNGIVFVGRVTRNNSIYGALEALSGYCTFSEDSSKTRIVLGPHFTGILNILEKFKAKFSFNKEMHKIRILFPNKEEFTVQGTETNYYILDYPQDMTSYKGSVQIGILRCLKVKKTFLLCEPESRLDLSWNCSFDLSFLGTIRF